ncbi:MAG: hypothetical protein HOV78_06705 [Hamadaea sp.]|nr:hypothetical protein [Hamadaea sp.]
MTLVTSLLVTPAGIAPASAATAVPGVLQGAITETETGSPLPGACAHVYSGSWEEVATACADASGHYATPVLPSATYRVKVTAAGHAERWLPGSETVFGAGSYTVSATTGPTVDVALPAHAGTFRGRVLTPEGTGQAWISVVVTRNGVAQSTTRTRADGTFEVPGLVPGDYGYYLSGSCLPAMSDAGPFTVTDGGTATAEYQYTTRTCTGAQRTFAGKVVDGVTGAVIPGAAYRLVYQQYNFEFAAGVSDSAGAYEVTGMGGLLSFRVQASAAGYPEQWANGGFTMTAGGLFVTTQTQIPLTKTFGELHGKITGPDGRPVQATVTVAGTGQARGTVSVVSGADGAYVFPQLAPGDWTMRITHPAFGTQWYPQAPYGGVVAPADAGHVTVTPNGVTTVDEQYAERAHVEVTLRDADTALPITDGCVQPNDTGVAMSPICENTAGVYRFDAVPSAVSSVTATSPSARQAGLAAAFKAGQTTRITLDLRPAGSIKVPIRHNADGTVPEACVTLVPETRIAVRIDWNSTYCNYNNGSPTDVIDTGQVNLGRYRVFATPDDTTLGSQWLGVNGGTGQQELAAVIDVRRGANTAPTVRFDPAGYLTGHVTGVVSGYGIAVRAWGANTGNTTECMTSPGMAYCTGNDSRYELRLGPYAWPLEAYAPYYGHTWYDGAANRTSAQLVKVESGQWKTVDLTIRAGNALSVTVPATVTDWRIEAYDAVTGDGDGVYWQNGLSSVSSGRKILRLAYVDSADLLPKSCWVYVPLAGRKITGIVTVGAGAAPKLTITPGKTCLQGIPALVPQRRTPPVTFDPAEIARPTLLVSGGTGQSSTRTTAVSTSCPNATGTRISQHNRCSWSSRSRG